MYTDSYNKLDKLLSSEWDQIQEGHVDLQAKKEASQNQNGGESVSDSNILKINAGGEIIRVSRGTLTQFQGTVLEGIFSGRWEDKITRDNNGCIFLDVQSGYFPMYCGLNARSLRPTTLPVSQPPAMNIAKAWDISARLLD
jgi:hypothetical protein